ncbi:hypothetical protein E9109_22860 [Salmonella enterica subsp. enterica serovar Goldcoast]|nr:hypothetical protein E9109_22860 [Salmonella enterica subsp. enterica serovar Goldcoast]
MGSCAAPSAKGDDKFITTDYLQQCRATPMKIYKPRPAVPSRLIIDTKKTNPTTLPIRQSAGISQSLIPLSSLFGLCNPNDSH